jgi:ferredoxin
MKNQHNVVIHIVGAMAGYGAFNLTFMFALLSANSILGFSCVRQGGKRELLAKLPLTRCFSSAGRDVVPIDEDSNDETPLYHQVTWKTSDGDVAFQARDGELLRTAALRREVVSPHNGKARLINCRGLGTCGTCAVEIDDGSSVEPPERNTREQLRLSFPPHGGDGQSPKLRLACQVQVHGDITVTKRTGFWGQYDELATKSDPETYFGDLEFVLDQRSPDS